MKSVETRARLIEESLQALSLGGLASLSIGRQAEAAGISKSGFFAHFKSKQSLEVAVLDQGARLAHDAIVAPTTTAADGIERLEALFGRWLGWANRAGLIGGCPMASALFELDDVGGQSRDQLAKIDQEWLDLLREQVEAAIALGQLDRSTDSSQVVFELWGIYLAHHVAARFRADRDATTRAITAFDALVARHLPRSSQATFE